MNDATLAQAMQARNRNNRDPLSRFPKPASGVRTHDLPPHGEHEGDRVAHDDRRKSEGSVGKTPLLGGGRSD